MRGSARTLRLPRLAAAMMLICAAMPAAAALPLDLAGRPALVREGFESSWVQWMPEEGDGAWKEIPGGTDRSLRARDFGLRDVPRWRPFSRAGRVYQFTILIPLRLADGDLRAGELGLFLPRIGQNWEIYLNGRLLRSELRLEGGEVAGPARVMKNLVVPLPMRELVAGDNLLGIRIAGDPFAEETGLPARHGYVVGALSSLKSPARDAPLYMLLAVSLFLGLYHVIIYLMRRDEPFGLWFALGALLLSACCLMRSDLALRFCDDTALLRHGEIIAMIMAAACIVPFLELFARDRLSLFAKACLVLSLIFSAAVVPFEREFLPLWRFLLPFMFLAALLFQLAIPLAAEVQERGETGAAAALLRGLVFTVTGNLLLLTAVLAGAAGADIVNAARGADASSTVYGLFIFTAGTAVILAVRSQRLQGEAERQVAFLEMSAEDREGRIRADSDGLASALAERDSLQDRLVATGRELEETRAAMERDMRSAARAQSFFLFASPPEDHRWDIDFAYQPLAGASGDLYDFYLRLGKLAGAGIFLVPGKGIGPGLVAITARQTIARVFREGYGDKLGTVAAAIDRALAAEIDVPDGGITGILLRFQDRTVEYLNAGHPDLVMLRAATGRARPVRPKDREVKGSPLGSGAMQGAVVLGIPVEPGDALLLYTGSLSGSVNAEGVPFGTDGIARGMESSPAGASASEMLAALLYEFRSFLGESPVSGDLTAVLLKRRS